MNANFNVTRGGGWLFGGSLGFAIFVGCLTWNWALTPLNKGVWRISPPMYYSSLFVIWGMAYLIGWLILRARGISVIQASQEEA
jgi:hypothetical protein